MIEKLKSLLDEIDINIIVFAKKGVLAGDICHRLNISKDEYYRRIRKIQSILNVYQEKEENIKTR